MKVEGVKAAAEPTRREDIAIFMVEKYWRWLMATTRSEL